MRSHFFDLRALNLVSQNMRNFFLNSIYHSFIIIFLYLYLTFACLGDLMTARVIVEDPYIIIMDLFHQKRLPIQMTVWMPMDSLHLEAVVSNTFYWGFLQKTIRLHMHVYKRDLQAQNSRSNKQIC